MKLKAGELSFNVLESGSAELALLFLHYWGGSARTWHAVASQPSTDFRCIAYDQRGWGESDAPEQGYSIGDLAVDARHIIEALHVRRYVLVGHSMGGKIAQFLAAQRPPGPGRTCACRARDSDTAKHSGTRQAGSASRLR
jgi:pimeloyl-ACP methyl ester carboxylesterase